MFIFQKFNDFLNETHNFIFTVDQILRGLIIKPNKQNYCDDFNEQVHSECTGLMANKTLVLYSQIVLLSLFKPVLFLSLS